jgi:hypothetical protein
MNDPFSGIPDQGTPRPISRRSQPGVVHEALRDMRDAFRTALPKAQAALRRAQRGANDALRAGQRHGRDLWSRGRRNPRYAGMAGGAVALTLAGAFAFSAYGADRSLCPPARKGQKPEFRLLMDQVPQAAAGSKMEIHYDVCGLPSGARYSGRVRLVQQQRTAGQKKSAQPKPLVVSFKDQVDGVATRREKELNLVSTRPGAYTLELVVADAKGRERKKVQKLVVKGESRRRPRR